MFRNKKRNTFIIAALILALMSASFFATFAVTEEEKAAAEQEAKEAKEAADAKKKEAKETAKKAAAAVKNLEEAEAKLEALQGDIEYTKAQIETTKVEIEQKKAEMKAKEDEIKEQNDALNNRLTAMYKSGNSGFVDVILSSESVQELLSNVGMVHKILESDQELLEKLQDDYEELKEMKQALEERQAALEEQELALIAQETETEELKKKYKEEADKLHAMEEQLEAEAAQMAAEAAALQVKAEQMMIDAGIDVKATPGKYAWPTQSNWVETSGYGWRICPFHGREFHNGLDLVLTSGTLGSPVYAMGDGVVTRASWYGGYGNCVVYAMPGGYSVICGHLRGYNCSVNQVIKKGQVIGYIGSTGNSTGPHLHWTVFKNGESVNPYSLY